MGELNFNYDVSLLQGDDEEEATAVIDSQQQEQEDQEVLQCWRAIWMASHQKNDRQKH